MDRRLEIGVGVTRGCNIPLTLTYSDSGHLDFTLDLRTQSLVILLIEFFAQELNSATHKRLAECHRGGNKRWDAHVSDIPSIKHDSR